MSRPYNPYYDGDDPEFANYNPKKTPTVVARISDYIDGDGEMLTVEMRRDGRDWRVTKMTTITSLDLAPKL